MTWLGSGIAHLGSRCAAPQWAVRTTCCLDDLPQLVLRDAKEPTALALSIDLPLAAFDYLQTHSRVPVVPVGKGGAAKAAPPFEKVQRDG